MVDGVVVRHPDTSSASRIASPVVYAGFICEYSYLWLGFASFRRRSAGVEIGACSICILKRSAKDERVVTDGLKRISSPLGRFTLAFIFQPVVGERQAHKPPDVVVFDLTVWKVPEDPLMLDTETTTSK